MEVKKKMRQSEIEALTRIRDELTTLLGGEVPKTKVVAAPKAAVPTKAVPKAAAAPTGQPILGWDEENGGYGCLACGEGVFKVGEAAAHVYEAHEVLLTDIVADPPESLTHGRKWMMKKYLEKNCPAALEGYGRAAKVEKPKKAKAVAKAEPAEAPAAPVKEKKWYKDPATGKWKKVKKEAPAEAPAAAAPAKKKWFKKPAEETGPNYLGCKIVFRKDGERPDGNENLWQLSKGEIVQEWDPNSQNFIVKLASGQVISIPKKSAVKID